MAHAIAPDDVANPATERFWDGLVESLAQGDVVPIIGPDLLEVDDGGVTVPLSHAITRRALAVVGVDAGPLGCTLQEAAVRCLTMPDGRRRLLDFYAAVHRVVSAPTFPIPAMLRDLAAIDAFTLYVTTAVDPLLQRALELERPNHHAAVYAYSVPKSSAYPSDLPVSVSELPGPTVFHLFGRTSIAKTWALTEEDVLEFVYQLQSAADRPKRLFAELGERSLLVIGSGYSDWIARIFLRLSRGPRLFDSRAVGEFLAHQRIDTDDSFVQFLQHFSERTQVFPGDAHQFVAELARRWKAYRATAPAPPTPVIEDTAPDAVFLSYPSECLTDARRVADALRSLGVPVWLDKRALHGGDDFEERIRQGIRRASLFVPILSSAVLSPRPRFFFREWAVAVDASLSYAGRKFIVPCRVDDVPLEAERMPPAFRGLHVADVRDDAALATFAADVRQLFRAYQYDRPAHP